MGTRRLLLRWLAVAACLGVAGVACREPAAHSDASHGPGSSTASALPAPLEVVAPPAPTESPPARPTRGVALTRATQVVGVPPTVTSLAGDGRHVLWADDQGLGELTPDGEVRRRRGVAGSMRDVGVRGPTVVWLHTPEPRVTALWRQHEHDPVQLLAQRDWGGSVRLRITPAGIFVGGLSRPGWQTVAVASGRATPLDSECNREDVGFLDASASVVAAVGDGQLCVGTPHGRVLRRVPGYARVSTILVDGDDVLFAAGSLGSDTNTLSTLFVLRAGDQRASELATGETFVVGIQRAGDWVYWLDERGTLRTTGATGGPASTLAVGPSSPRGQTLWRLVQDDRYLYWIVPGSGMYRAEKIPQR